MSKSLSPLALSLKEAVATLKTQKALVAQLRERVAAEREATKVDKILTASLKRDAAIAKAQARLQKLLEKQAAPVGAKAIKANKRPGKVTTYGAEDNAIASAIMAKKASAK
jgi:hypothetical protein